MCHVPARKVRPFFQVPEVSTLAATRRRLGFHQTHPDPVSATVQYPCMGQNGRHGLWTIIRYMAMMLPASRSPALVSGTLRAEHARG